MNYLRAIALLGLIWSIQAEADVWKWVDPSGKTHYLESRKPVYTWVDQSGKAHYSDRPDHEDAVMPEVVWHSKGTLKDLEKVGGSKEQPATDGSADGAYPGETDEQRAERERAEAYYCDRATEIYESYVNAPELYRTGPDGEREYLSAEEAARTIAETRARKDEICN